MKDPFEDFSGSTLERYHASIHRKLGAYGEVLSGSVPRVVKANRHEVVGEFHFDQKIRFGGYVHFTFRTTFYEDENGELESTVRGGDFWTTETALSGPRGMLSALKREIDKLHVRLERWQGRS